MKPVRNHNSGAYEADDALVEMDAVELTAFKVAVDEARADKRGVPHDEVADWLKRIEAGYFDAPMPVPRALS